MILPFVIFIFTYMEKLRIINDKTGEVKHVVNHIAKNTKLLKSYGFRLQDLSEKEIKEPIISKPKKRGRKPNQNI